MGANSAYPGAFDNLVTGIDGSQRNDPSLADVINKLQSTLGITGAFKFLPASGVTATMFEYAGNPNAHISALAAGDLCVDSSTPGLWQASASGNSSWSQVAGSGGAVSSFNTRTGVVTLTKADVTGTGLAAADVGALTPSGNGSSLTGITISQVSGGAPLASPTFTGIPAAPTATAGTSTTQLATTAFVAASFAPLASPTFTGSPAAPTASVGTNTTQLATTAFVQAGAPVNVVSTSFTTNAYTLALTDAQTHQQASNGSTAATITIPLNASVAFPIGTVITITQTGSGKIQIATSATIVWSGTFTSGTTGCNKQGSTIGLLKVATDTWVLSGDAA